MNVSRRFLRDFAYLANYYGWTPADIEDVKADTRASPGLVAYWSTLANAHRNGYEQTRGNGYIRLLVWCEQQGLADPYLTDSMMARTEVPIHSTKRGNDACQ